MSDLQGLRERGDQRSFAQWDGHVPDQLVSASEKTIHELADRLIALGEHPTRDAVQVEVTRAVQRFNELDDVGEHPWICTIEREDIGEAIWRLTRLCGFDSSQEWLRGRDW